ncbi:MAG: glutathione S-transferase [Pseudomonadota bacterium]
MTSTPTKPKLWHTRHSRSLRPLWLAYEMGLELEVQTIPNDRSYFASAAWAAINPAGKVPVLHDGEARIGESIAIMQYLMARHGPTELDVAPSEAEYGAYLFWLHYAEAGSCAYIATLLGHVAGVPEYQVSDAHLALLDRQLERLQSLTAEATGGRPHLHDRGFSAADVALGYTFHLARFTKRPWRDEVQSYMDALYARPAFARAIALGKT